MEKLTILELTLLKLIFKGNGESSWYNLEMGLSRRDVPRVPSMMVVLKDLIDRGLVTCVDLPGTGFDKWSLTEKGLALLEAIEQPK